MVVLGLASKLAVFPFANWVADVYKGCESSILAFLSTIPELAVFGIICRLLVFPLSNSFELTFVVAIISLATAFWANTYAIRENNVKVILACSVSANSSYILMTASLVSVYNLSTVIFYLICYSIMNLGVFAFLNIYGDKNIMNVNDFQGIFHKNYGLVGAYALAILALAGIPITSGFIAKIYLFTAIANSGLIFVPFLLGLLLLTVIALYYYLKILLPLFETKNNSELKNLNPAFSQKFVLVVCTIITLVLGIFPEVMIELCRYIAYSI
jgi:NADH-quinone oxidoreductase subunit N